SMKNEVIVRNQDCTTLPPDIVFLGTTTAARSCLQKYIIFTYSMVLVTVITTTCVATIEALRHLYDAFYIPLVFSVLGATFLLVLSINEKVRETFPLNDVLISLSVLSWSIALPVVTKSVGFSIFSPWGITITLAVMALIIGYKTVKRSAKVSFILLGVAGGITVLGIILLIALRLTKRELIAVILFGIFLAFAVLIVLYLTGQGIKRCNKETTRTLLPSGLALITWAEIVYLFVSIAVMFI
ncbi:unnamed protein product, partial [Trichobilharzia szidati]